MARPRVFISSTFYDLRHVRADIDAFLTELGFEAVANERGEIPYGSEEALEEYCYKEIESVDILVSIIGGRFGSESGRDTKSISQMEIMQAIKLGRQVYIFIDADVNAEFSTYLLNKDLIKTKYAHADDVRIFKFIEEIRLLKSNNAIFPFRESSEIVTILREQFSGLFQRLLRSASRQEEVRIIDQLKATSTSLQELVRYVTEQSTQGDKIVNQILLPSHPAFPQMAETLGLDYRIYFENLAELQRFLSARGFKYEPGKSDKKNFIFERKATLSRKSANGTREWYTVPEEFRISRSLFNDRGDLKVIPPDAWDRNLISIHRRTAEEELDDEIPF